MMKKWFKYLFLLLAFTFCIGYSSWVTVSGVKTDSLLTMIETEPVCYLQEQNGSNKRYFSTVEKALSVSKENSNQEIVILKTKGNTSNTYTITENCTVKAGTTLTIPYYRNDDTSNTPYVFSSDQIVTKTAFACNTPGTYLTCELRIGKNKTLTNNGTIKIGGIIGAGQGGSYPASQTVSEYGQITMYDNSTINNYGNIYNYGYIQESTWCNNSKVYNYSNSYYYSIFTLIEFRGGSITFGMYKDTQCAPFNRFMFANCTTNIIFDYSSKMEAFCTIYASDQYNSTSIVIISTSSDALIQLKSGSRLEFKLNKTREVPATGTTTNVDLYSVMILNFYGDFQLNSLKLTLKLIFTFNINTSSVLLPVSHLLNVYLHTKDGITPANVVLNQQIKVMPGSELYIDKNVTVSGSTIVVTDSCLDKGIGAVNSYPSVDKNLTKGISTSSGLTCAPGYLLNNGVCNLNNLGGYIQTNKDQAIMVCSNNVVTSKELDGYSGSNILTTVTYNSEDFTLSGDTYNSGTITKNQTLSSGAYKSNTANNVDFGWEVTTDINYYTINFNANGGTLTCDSSIKFIMIGDSITLNSLSVSDPYKDYYDFSGWYLDPECTQSAIGKTVNKNDTLTVYAKYNITNYSISYYGTCDGEDFAKFTSENITSVTYDDLKNGETIALQQPTILESSGTKFLGWYIDNNLEQTIEKIDLSLLKLYKDQGLKDIVIFGKFTNSYEIHFVVGNGLSDEYHLYIPGTKLDLPMHKEYFDLYDQIKYLDSWYYDDKLTNPFVEGDEFDSSKIKDGVTLYANWVNKDSTFSVKDKNSSNTEVTHPYYFQSGNITSDFSYTAQVPDNAQFNNWEKESSSYSTEPTLTIISSKINDSLNGKTIVAKYKYKIVHKTSLYFDHYVKIVLPDSTTIVLDSHNNSESGSVTECYVLEGLIIKIYMTKRFARKTYRTLNIYKYNTSSNSLLSYTNKTDSEAYVGDFTMTSYALTFKVTE